MSVPSKRNPIYTISVATKSGMNLQLDNVVVQCKIYDYTNEIAQRVKLQLNNVTSDGYLLSEVINPLDRVFIYSNDGETTGEIFRGFVWIKKYTNDCDRIINLTLYDNLIYLMQSEDSRYYTSGKSTEDVLNDICWAWGIDLKYNYKSVSHKKMPLSGNLADMITTLLDKVEKNTGYKYAVRSIEDIMHIDCVGINDIFYEINRYENVISTSSTTSMEDVITRVTILGKANEDGSYPINETIDGDISTYGTIQKILREKSSDTSDEENEKETTFESTHDEAQWYLNEYGQPKLTFEVEAIDIPWIRKGDIVKIGAGDMNFRYIVIDIMHDCILKKMNLKLEIADETKLDDSTAENTEAEAGKMISLTNAPIYVSSDSQTVAGRVSGTYYLYDGKEILGRYRITDILSNVGKTPIGTYVTGWLPKEYI